MGNTASYVTAGKPAIAGAIHVAPKGSELPTDATTALDTSIFKALGYCSEDGLTNATSIESTEIKAWGGATVLTIQTSKDDNFTFTLIEVLNLDVLKFVYGASNVTGDLESGITVKVNDADVEEVALVIDMILRDNTARRIVIPDCKISEMGDIVYSDGEAVGYETTVVCMPDAEGNKHYEYTLRSGEISA